MQWRLGATALFWGGTFIAARHLAGEVLPFSAAFLRFLIASFVLLLMVKQVDEKQATSSRRKHKLLLSIQLSIMGLTGVVAYNFFFFQGLHYVEAGRAAVVIALTPITLSLCSSMLFREAITRGQLVALPLALLGALIVVSRGDIAGIFSRGIGRGELVVSGCVASWVVYALVGKAVMKTLSPLRTVAYSSFLGTVFLAVPACLENILETAPGYSFTAWCALAYLAVFGTALGFSWFYRGIAELGVAKTAVFINMVPVCAVVLGWVILGEELTLAVGTGSSLVVCALFLSGRTRATSTKNPPATAACPSR